MLQRPLLVMPYTGPLSLMGTCAFCLFFRGGKDDDNKVNKKQVYLKTQ